MIFLRKIRKLFWTLVLAWMLGLQAAYREEEQRPEPVVIRFQGEEPGTNPACLNLSGYFDSIMQARVS